MAVRSHILVCGGAGCVSSGCKAVVSELKNQLDKHSLDKEIRVFETGCLGSCDVGPCLVVYPDGVFYQKLNPEDMVDLVEEHLVKGRVVDRLYYVQGDEKNKIPLLEDIDFFKKQTRIALRNMGLIDPLVIEEYIARDGYAALGKVLTQMTPADVVDTIKKAGLRGRGGGGFSTGMKWGFAQAAKGDTKYVVCNADEGDPGAFMDRSVLEGDPHAIIEAMAIAGYAIGANQGYVYVRAEYPLAVHNLGIAIEQARKMGLLGKDIFSSGFDFDLEIRVGAGAFVCGEETALLASIEGKRGTPRPRPPYPVNSGLWEKPTLINNVETYANICPIILRGAEWFASIGTATSKGTKVFAVAGDVNNTGLVEVPMGTTVREIIFGIGGGIPGGKKFKAAQTGGPSGGCVPAHLIDTPVDYDSLQKIGSMMGSGGLIVMDEKTCMVDIARFFIEFTQDESCGKCTPCRIGTKRMLEILERITSGEGRPGDIELLEELSHSIKDTSLCGLGQSAPNPVLSTIKYFRDEYEAHINEKRCPAGICQNLVSFIVESDKCVGCGICKRSCPTDAIVGERRQAHIIENDKCVKCGKCEEVCPFKAIIRR